MMARSPLAPCTGLSLLLFPSHGDIALALVGHQGFQPIREALPMPERTGGNATEERPFGVRGMLLGIVDSLGQDLPPDALNRRL